MASPSNMRQSGKAGVARSHAGIVYMGSQIDWDIIVDLQTRVAYLELPFYKKAFLKIKGLFK